MNKRRLSIFLAVILLVSFTLIGCTPKEEDVVTKPPVEKDKDVNKDASKDASEPPVEKVYRFTDTKDVTSLNPHNQAAYLVGDITIYTDSLLYRRVPNEDRTGDMIIGDIANGDPYLVDGDYVWHIPLRKDAVWQNGEPINADTFIYSFKMLIDPDLVNPLGSFLYANYITIENAKEYFMQNAEGAEKVDWEDVGIKKVDDYTLEITTDELYSAQHVKLHFNSRAMHPVYEEYYEAGMNDSRTSTTYGTTLDKYVGSGPYKFKEWNQDANRSYVKNHDHWMADYFNYDRIEVRVVPDSNSRVQLFESGEIDVLSVDSALLDKYEDDPRLKKNLSLACRHLDINSINTEKPILSTFDFRKAIYHGIDRETIAELVGYLPSGYYINHQAGGIPEEGILYRDTPEAKAVEPENYGYDPELAKKHFDAALEEVNETSVSIEFMLTDTNEDTKRIAEYMQESLPKIFGKDKFSMTLRFVPSANFSAMQDWKADPNAFEILADSWSATLSRLYPYTAFQYFISDYSSRPNSYVTERFDQKFKELQAEELRVDPQRMVELTAELEKIYYEDVISIPVGQSYSYTMYSDRVQLPLEEYAPGFGFGTMFGDIVD